MDDTLGKELTEYAILEVEAILRGLHRLKKSKARSKPIDLTGYEYMSEVDRQYFGNCVDIRFWLFSKMTTYAKSRWETLRNRRYYLVYDRNVLPNDKGEAHDEAMWFKVYNHLASAEIEDGWRAEHLLIVPWVSVANSTKVIAASLHQIESFITTFTMELGRLELMLTDPDTMPSLCILCKENVPLRNGTICKECFTDLAYKDIPEGYTLFENPGCCQIPSYRHLSDLTGIPILIDDKMVNRHGKQPRYFRHRALVPEEYETGLSQLLGQIEDVAQLHGYSWGCGLPKKMIEEIVPSLIPEVLRS